MDINNEDKISTVEHALDKEELEPLPDYGDLMTLDEFIEHCNSGAFINYDGTGHYATKTKMSRLYATPSKIKAGNIDRSWTHVMWFNR
jgi:hypothetical protein